MMLLATAVVAVGVLGQGAAAAGTTPSAVDAMHRLDLLTTQRDRTAQSRATAQNRLASLRAHSRADRKQLATDRWNMGAARVILAEMLVRDYKSTSVDPTMYVLASGSFSDLIDRVDTLNRIDAGQTAMITAINADSVRLHAAEARLQVRRRAEAAVVGQLTADQARLDAQIAAQQSLLASLTHRTRVRVVAEQHRRHHLAATHSSGGGSSNSFSGDVTWYGPGFAGQRTADGEIFDPSKLTAASPWLPFNTMLRVTSTVTGRSVVVRVNDRGPFGSGVLDLSAHSAQVIGLSGWQLCRLAVLSEP